MQILDNREQWLDSFRAGWQAHYQQTGELDWKIYNRPKNGSALAGPGVDLRKRRLILISSAGGYLRDQQAPFDAPNPLGDYTVRLSPSATPFTALAYAHDHCS